MPEHIAAISKIISDFLPTSHNQPEINLLFNMMRDYPERGGKMIRSRLLVLSCLAHGGKESQALKLGAALELFQNWVLIHDDIEDESEERRGKPALHKLHGVPLAINAGDALHVYMWQLVLEANVTGAAQEFLNMIHRTAEGQHMDLAWIAHNRFDVSPNDYLSMIRLKTAQYTVVSPLRLGALAAGVVPDARFLEAGLSLGVAFQIRDDVLNLEGNHELYGKEIAGDLYEGKRTLMLSLLLQSSKISLVERQEIMQTLGKPRQDKTQKEIENILLLMRRESVIESAQELAGAELDKGLVVLLNCLMGLPNQTAAKNILQQCKQLASRNS